MLQAVPPSTVVWGVPTPLQAPHWGLIPSHSGARISHDRSRAALHHRPPCEAVLQQRPGSGLRCSGSGASSQIGWGPVPLRIAECDAMVTSKTMPCVAHLLPSLSLPRITEEVLAPSEHRLQSKAQSRSQQTIALHCLNCLSRPGFNREFHVSSKCRSRYGAQLHSEQDIALYSVPAAFYASARFMLHSLGARCTLHHLRWPHARLRDPSQQLVLR